MGYEVTYHPISDVLMKQYVQCLASDDYAIQLCDNAGVQELNKGRLVDMLASFRPPSHTGFDGTHGAYIAIMQGFFDRYYYLGGCMLSAAGPALAPYVEPWAAMLPELEGTDSAANVLQGEFSSGVYIAPDRVLALMEDMHANAELHAAISAQFPASELEILWAALLQALELGVGVLEAAGVVQHGEDPAATTSFSDIANCDPAGLDLARSNAASALNATSSAPSAATSALPATASASPSAAAPPVTSSNPDDWHRVGSLAANPYGVDDQMTHYLDHALLSADGLGAFTHTTAGLGLGLVLDWKEGYLVEQRCRDIVDQHIGWSDEDFWRMAELQFTCGEDVTVDQGLGAFAAWLRWRGGQHVLVSTTTNADYFFAILHPSASSSELMAALASCGIEAHVHPASAIATPVAAAPQEVPLPWQTSPAPGEDIRTTAGTERGLSARLRARRDAGPDDQANQ